MLGYSLVPEAQGAGLATEAAAALVAFACGHPRVARVAAETFPSLLPSIRVLTRLGFERVPDAEEPGAIRFERHRDVDLVARHPLLARHGWNAWLAAAYRSCADARDLPGRVLATHRTRLVVALPLGNVVAAPDADMRRAVATDSRARPSTGDWVIVRSTEPSTGPATVRMILPRATTIVRRAPGTAAAPQVLAANVDVALIVVALTEPLNLRRLERFLTLAWESDVQPLVVLTKADAVSGAGTVAGMVAAVRAAVPGVETVTVSATDHVGLTILRARLGPGITAVLLGPSGVGKSTLLNRLAGQEVVATGAVRRDGGGRHTTTRRELHGLPWGALVIDTPGMRELQLWAGHEGLEHTFQDIVTLAGSCRFRDCAHDAEPGCAVRGAVARGALEPQRLASWQKLAREAARAAREHDVHAAAAARARVRSSHRALEARLREKYD
jgi:ribosome biogenesis GTPase